MYHGTLETCARFVLHSTRLYSYMNFMYNRVLLIGECTLFVLIVELCAMRLLFILGP